MDAAKLYVIYLRALDMGYVQLQAHVRSLRHTLEFYWSGFQLGGFDGKCILQYADLHDPDSDDPYNYERGRLFWRFIHWLKKNKMIPAWTEPEE